MDAALQAELDAIRPATNKPFVEPVDWQSTAERVIRQAIAECHGRDSRILNLTLLCRFPFTLEQTEAKTIWYAELRRQTGLPESTEIELNPVLKSVIPRDEWVTTVRTIVRETRELYSPYSRKNPGQWSDDTKKLEAFFLELKRRLPFEMDPDEIPTEIRASTTEQQIDSSYHRDFQAVWYQVCAQELGFHEPPPRSLEQANATPAPSPPKERQKRLF